MGCDDPDLHSLNNQTEIASWPDHTIDEFSAASSSLPQNSHYILTLGV